jgi:hypothetical protein
MLTCRAADRLARPPRVQRPPTNLHERRRRFHSRPVVGSTARDDLLMQVTDLLHKLCEEHVASPIRRRLSQTEDSISFCDISLHACKHSLLFAAADPSVQIRGSAAISFSSVPLHSPAEINQPATHLLLVELPAADKADLKPLAEL